MVLVLMEVPLVLMAQPFFENVFFLRLDGFLSFFKQALKAMNVYKRKLWKHLSSNKIQINQLRWKLRLKSVKGTKER